MSTWERTNLSNSSRTHVIIEVDDFVPLGLVPYEMNFYGNLLPVLVSNDVSDASCEPLAHLVQYVHTIIYLELHSTSPLFEQAWSANFDPIVILRIEASVMDE